MLTERRNNFGYQGYDSGLPQYSAAYELTTWQPTAKLFTIDSDHGLDFRHPWIFDYLPDAMEKVFVETIGFMR
jgi:hypothetical protein